MGVGRDICANCQMIRRDHSKGKCLFEPVTFKQQLFSELPVESMVMRWRGKTWKQVQSKNGVCSNCLVARKNHGKKGQCRKPLER